ncbi:hypothetical protein AQUCO_00700240v1 [Aquilegia coerulea]|uniref:F-box domain-containing protein n=1 Tax=Aquilegia coerulea TaxID=218851 RepID=A0A2G5EJ41_AQUCA|nr:hypothetical protein AQUCO_00700240v1 [Aquilegia coerulea]
MAKMSLCSIPPAYAPSLVFSHGKRFRDQTFCTLSDGCYHVGRVPLMGGMFCVTSSHGWLLMRSYYYSTECYLFNPISLTKIHLPPVLDITYVAGVLTSSPSDPDCIVMLISNAKRSSIFCRIGDNKFIEQKLESKKKDPITIKGCISVISCKGKIYLFFKQGMGVVDVHSTFLSIKLHKINYPSPSLPWISCYARFFLESCGEIFHVAESRFGISHNLPQKCDVFKLDVSTMDWVMVDNLGDQIFLLGLYSTSVPATDLGLKPGCIYFCLYGDTSLYMFDMHDGTITNTLPCPKKIPYWKGPFWVVPNCKFQVKKEVVKLQESTHQGNQEWGWKDLPVELLELIASFLFLGDCIRFRLTCKSWISVTPPLRANCLFNKFEFEPPQVPWLMSFPKTNQGVCKLYHPVYGDAYTMNIPELADAIIRNAKYGWLLMSQGISFFFFNPITMEVIKLPDIERDYQFIGMSFSSPPTSSDFVVFGFLGFYMVVYRKGEERWSRDFFKSSHWEFLHSPCNPIFYDGAFYCLGKNGRLLLFDTKEVVKESQYSDITKSNESFIVEYDGEILSIFVGPKGKKIFIFKLDLCNMKWCKLESLDDKVLFLSHTASILLPAAAVGLKGIENRIYFPRFHESDNMFYSLSTRKYQCCGSRYSCDDWISTSKLSHCSWIQSGHNSSMSLTM